MHRSGAGPAEAEICCTWTRSKVSVSTGQKRPALQLRRFVCSCRYRQEQEQQTNTQQIFTSLLKKFKILLLNNFVVSKITYTPFLQLCRIFKSLQDKLE